MQLTDSIENDDVEDFDTTDYIFVVSNDGRLKSVLLPDDFETNITPDNVTKILEIFDVDNFHSGTIH
jgi:Mg/Co/Ni transporter MgtE